MAENKGVVIVAIPTAYDRVWRLSSEKIPHLTIAYLADDADNLVDIVHFVSHASSMMAPFGLSVDKRGTLGDKNADVLFFELGALGKSIEGFRHNLLADSNTARAYLSTEQFPTWTPHLTLGYPSSPAKKDDRDYEISYVDFDRIAVWSGDYEGPEFKLKYRESSMMADPDVAHSERLEDFLAHHGVKGQKWGVRRDERPLGKQDVALNIAQRSQVKVASTISALAAVGMSTNAAATLFQLQNRFERLQAVNAVIEQAQNNPLLSQASREALKNTKANVIKGIIGSAMATTAISLAIGIVTRETAKAYFAPMHKVYGDAKPKINSDLRKLSKDIKGGKRPKMTVKDYNTEVSKIVQKHMTDDKSNFLKPFHELARSQLGLQYNTKALDIKFEKLPNTDLMNKMTVTTPDGLVLIKAIKVVEHAKSETLTGFDFYFDYKFDADGYISDFSCPTLEVLKRLVDGTFTLNSVGIPEEASVTKELKQSDDLRVDTFLEHFGIKGMRWGIRRRRGSDGTVEGGVTEGESKSSTSSGGGTKDGEFISADAERVIKTKMKKGHEMSDREMKEAIQRANLIKQYNEIYNPGNDPHYELKKKVERLELQKKYGQLNAELHPSRVKQVAKFIAGAAPGFAGLKQLDNATGNYVSNEIRSAFKDLMAANEKTKASRPKRGPESPVTKGADNAAKADPKKPRSKAAPDPIYDITDVGRDRPYGDPSILQLNSRR